MEQLIFWACFVLFVYILVCVIDRIAHIGDKDESVRECIPLRPVRRIVKYPKTKLGRCEASVGRYGFDVSNPIRIKNISDKYVSGFFYNRIYKEQVIVGFTAAFVCRCQNINKPIYKFAVKLGDGKFLTLFFVEDGVTSSIKYYPNGFYRKPSGEHVDDRIRYSLRISEEQMAERTLLIEKYSQKGLPILRENILETVPIREDGNTQGMYNQKELQTSERNRMLHEYLAFIRANEKENTF